MIHIIADSTSAIPQEMLSKYSNLHVIPLSLSIKGEYIPENEATIRQVIEYSEKTNQAIPTSQPSTGDFLNAFNLIPEKDDIIVMHHNCSQWYIQWCGFGCKTIWKGKYISN